MYNNIQTDYISQITDTYINTDGIYETLWKKFNRREQIGPFSINLSRFIGNQETYYTIENKNNNQETYNVIFTIHLSMEITPLNMISDYLNKFEHSNKYKYFIYFSYDNETLLNNASFGKYINSIYQMLAENLGTIPHLLNFEDLNKIASFKGWQVVQLGTEWYTSNNFIIHYLLSKGALISSSIELDNILRIIELSPHHQLKIGLITSQLPRNSSF